MRPSSSNGYHRALSVRTLYIEELKATMRGRFAWLGAAVVFLAVGAGATIGTQDTWLDGYGIIAYFLVCRSVVMTFMPHSRHSGVLNASADDIHTLPSTCERRCARWK